MNTYNHHRIIKEFAKQQGIGEDSQDYKCLMEASDYTDDLAGESNSGANFLTQKNYFFYHYYYDIECKDNTIVLSRSKHNESTYESSMRKCKYEEKDFKPKPDDYDYMLLVSELTDSPINYKKFYNIINDREELRETYFNKYVNVKPEQSQGISGIISHKVKSKKLDSSNQSDCVAFLHAMGSYEESQASALEAFKNHVINCFAEYLFLQDQKESMYMLGIAFHSIMDSFTPSHTGFKNYAKQNMALHAQGDVIVFKDDTTKFSPGQFGDDLVASGGRTFIPSIVKGYNGDDHVNNTEYDMLKVFLKCFMDIKGGTALQLLNGEKDISKKDKNGKVVSNRSKEVLNKILSDEVHFNEEALNYSQFALDALAKLYEDLKGKRKDCNNYDNYKKAKKELANVLQKWFAIYSNIQGYVGVEESLYIYTRAQGEDEDLDIFSLGDFICDSANEISKLVQNLKNSEAGQYIKNLLLDKINAAAEQIADIMGDLNPIDQQALSEVKNKLVEKCDKVIKKAQEIIHTADGVITDIHGRIAEIKKDVDMVLGTAKTICKAIKGVATDIKEAAKFIQQNLDKYAKTLTDTVSNAVGGAKALVNQAQQTVTNFGQQMYNQATGLVNQFSGAVNGACEKVKGAAKTIVGLTDAAQAQLGGIIPPVVFDKIRGCADAITDTMDKAKNSVDEVTGKVNDGLKKANDFVKDKAKEIADKANGVLQDVEEKVNGYINTAKDKADEWLTSAQDYCDKVIKQVEDIEKTIDGIQTMADNYMAKIDTIADLAHGYLGQADQLLGFANNAIGQAGQLFDSALGSAGNVLGDLAGQLTGQASEALGSVANTAGNALGNALGQLGNQANGMLGSAVDTLGNMAGQAGEMLGSAVDTLGNMAGQAGEMLGSAVDTLGNMAGQAGEMLGSAVDSLGDMAGQLAGQAGEMLGSAVDTLGNMAGELGNAVGDMAGQAGEMLGSAVDTLGNAVGELGNAAGEMAGQAGEALGSAVGSLGNAAGELGNAAGEMAGELGNQLGDLGNVFTNPFGSGK